MFQDDIRPHVSRKDDAPTVINPPGGSTDPLAYDLGDKTVAAALTLRDEWDLAESASATIHPLALRLYSVLTTYPTQNPRDYTMNWCDSMELQDSLDASMPSVDSSSVSWVIAPAQITYTI